MKNKFITGVIIGGLLFGTAGAFAVQYVATENPFPVHLNGKNVSIEGYNIEGSTYFKLRDIADIIGGFDVGFDGTTIQLAKDGYSYSSDNVSNVDIHNYISSPLDTDEEVKDIYYPSLDYYKKGNFYCEVNSAGGVKLNWCANNLTDKTIKYITMTLRLYNRVNDLLPDDYGQVSHEIKFTGPIEPHGSLWLYTDRPFAYANTCQSVSIDEMTIEYTDGTIISGNYGYATTWKR
ncbi:MAG: hypothetical protein IJJ55_06765 [Clostridia bacterium]|nr:hypothetical protein [Clostridia bacterium]